MAQTINKKEIAINTLENFIKLIKKGKVQVETLDVEELLVDKDGLTANDLVIGFFYDKPFDTLVTKINKGN